MWGQQLNSATAAEKTAIKHKMARATYTQTCVYLKPLMRKLKKRNLPEDICDSLMEITKHLLERNYIMVSYIKKYVLIFFFIFFIFGLTIISQQLTSWNFAYGIFYILSPAASLICYPSC